LCEGRFCNTDLYGACCVTFSAKIEAAIWTELYDARYVKLFAKVDTVIPTDTVHAL